MSPVEPISDDEFRAWIIKFQDGLLSSDQVETFESILRSDERKRLIYIQIEKQSAEIARRLKRQDNIAQSRSASTVAPCKVQSFGAPRSRLTIWISAAVACAIIAIVVALSQPRDNRGELPVQAELISPNATITHANNASWSGDLASIPVAGTDLKSRTHYFLSGGAIRLRMASGGIVSLEGPTEFKISDKQQIDLIQGRLAAWSPDKAGRLTVQVGSLGIHNQGTALGVHANQEQDVDLAVFKGSVELEFTGDDRNLNESTQSNRSKTILTGGDAVSVSQNASSAQAIEFDSAPYTQLWPLAAGIDEVSHLIDFVPPGPKLDLESLASDDRLFLIPERLNQPLMRPMAVDLARDQNASQVVSWPRPNRDRDIPVIPKGRVLSSYLLLYRPENQKPSTYRTLSGSVTFEKPIAAVSVQGKRLQLSQRIFGLPEVSYGERLGRTLEDKPVGLANAPADSLQISADGRRLDFELNVHVHSDHIRVLVDETIP